MKIEQGKSKKRSWKKAEEGKCGEVMLNKLNVEVMVEQGKCREVIVEKGKYRKRMVDHGKYRKW